MPSLLKALPAIALLVPLLACGGNKKKLGEDPLPYYSRGAQWLKQGRPDRAIIEFRRATEIDPKVSMFRNSLGLAYYAQNDLPSAREEFLRILDSDPYFTEAHNNLGIVYAAEGKLDEALQEFDMVLRDSRYETPELAQFNRARVYRQRGQVVEALESLRGALERSPDNAEWHYLDAELLEESGDLAGAATAYERTVELAPRSVDAWFHLGDVRQKVGDTSAACAAYARVERLAAGSRRGREARSRRAELRISAPDAGC